jgi:nucleoside-diphosphate-sugar epimerase
MKVLFTGGTGNLSFACTEWAVTQGMEVYLINRGQTRWRTAPEKVTVLTADIQDPVAVRKAMGEHRFDAVVQFRGFRPEHIEADLDAFRGRTDQYVFISSASAYQKPPVHYLITESTPLANPYWEYSRLKIACELRLMAAYREEGFPVTIVRPSHTYDLTWIPSAVGGQDFTVVDRIRCGKKIIVHGDGQSLWTMTHATDFAKGLVGLLGNTQAIGESFHITSDEVLSWDQIYNTIGQAAGLEAKIVHISSEQIGCYAPEWLSFLLGDKACSMVFDNTKIKRAVPGFQATTLFATGVRRSVEWFDADESRKVIDGETDAMIDRIIEGYEDGLPNAH